MYILLLNPGTRVSILATDFHGFIETFEEYQDAKREGEIYKESGDCKEFQVFGMCADERNHII